MSEEKKNETLYDAVRSGDVGDVRRLLDDGARVDQRVDDGCKRKTLLHVAAERGHVSVMELLLEKGGDFNASDTHGDTPLHRAASNGNKAAVRCLLDQKCNVDTRNCWGSTPLHRAAEEGYTEVIACIVERGGDVNAKDNNGDTPLHDAAYYGNKAAVRCLLDQKCNVDTRNCRGSTPLHIAARWGWTEVIACIAERGGDVNSTDKDGNTPLHITASNGNKAAVRCLLDQKCNVDTRNSGGSTPLHDAACEGYTEVIACIAERGGDVNATDKDGDTPLHKAARSGYTEVIACIVERGGDVNAKNITGDTPLHDAARSGYTEVIACIAEGGGDVNATNEDGDTPLHLAVLKLRTVDVTLLQRYGAEVTLHPSITLHDAVLSDCVQLFKLLVEAGADVNATFCWLEETLLHRAVRLGYLDIVEELIRSGCDVNAADQQGNTPLHFAAQHGRHGLIKTLVDAGGNVNSPGEHDRTPLHVAVCKRKRTCVSALLGLNADTECVDGDGKTARDLSPTKAITKLLSDQSAGGCNVAIPTNEQPLVNRKRRHEESIESPSSKTRQLCHPTVSNDKAPEAAQIQTSPDLSNTYFKRPYITSITPVGVNTSTVTSPSQSMMSLLNNTSDEHGPSSSDYIFSPSDINMSSVTSPSTPQMSGEHGSSVVRDEIHPTTSYEQAEASHLVYTVQSSAKSQQSMHGNATYITTTASSIQKPEDTSDASNLGLMAHSFETPKLTTLTPEKGHVSSSIDLQDDDNYNDWDSLERPNVTEPLHVNFENRTQEQSTYINDVGFIPNHILAVSSSLPHRPHPQSAGDMHLIPSHGKAANMDGIQFPPDQIPIHSRQMAQDQIPTHSREQVQDQVPIHSRQMAQDQIPTHSRQLAQDQITSHSTQLAPDQVPTHSRQMTPDQVPTHSRQMAQDQIPTYSGQLAEDQIPTYSTQLTQDLNQMHTQPTPDTNQVRPPLLQVTSELYLIPSHSTQMAQPGQLAPVQGPPPYWQGKTESTILPLQPDIRQLSIELTPLQVQCRQQAEEIRRLQDEVVSLKAAKQTPSNQSQAQIRQQAEEIRRLQDEVVSLKAATKPTSNQCQSEVGQLPDTNQIPEPSSRPTPTDSPTTEAPVVPPLYERPPIPNHYKPTHGQRIPQCLYRILPAGQSAPKGYEQLAEGSACNVIVPSDWMDEIRTLCKYRSPSYKLKKMVDGLYEPEELYKKKASSVLYSTDLGKALRSYAIDVLKMESPQVTAEFNSKITTVNRRCRQQPKLLQ